MTRSGRVIFFQNNSARTPSHFTAKVPTDNVEFTIINKIGDPSAYGQLYHIQGVFEGALRDFALKVTILNTEEKQEIFVKECIMQDIIFKTTANDNHYDCQYTPRVFWFGKTTYQEASLGLCIMEKASGSFKSWLTANITTNKQDMHIGLIRISRKLKNLWDLYQFTHHDFHDGNQVYFGNFENLQIIDFGMSKMKFGGVNVDKATSVLLPGETAPIRSTLNKTKDILRLILFLKVSGYTLSYSATEFIEDILSTNVFSTYEDIWRFCDTNPGKDHGTSAKAFLDAYHVDPPFIADVRCQLVKSPFTGVPGAARSFGLDFITSKDWKAAAFFAIGAYALSMYYAYHKAQEGQEGGSLRKKLSSTRRNVRNKQRRSKKSYTKKQQSR